MSQKLSLGAFKWVKNTPQFSKDFSENYNEDSNEGNLLEVDVQYLETLSDLQNDLLFYLKKRKLKKLKNLQPTSPTKMNVTHIGNLKQSVKHGLLLKKLQPLNLLKNSS